LNGPALPGALYLDLLARLHSELPPRTYLEIGVGSGASLGFAGRSEVAIGIDPEPQIGHPLPPSVRLFQSTSDDFFARHDLKAELGGRELDLAFIDGMHLFEFALRDFINVERNSAPGTVVLVHDCYPIDAATSARERATRFWTGDVWKLIACLRKYRPDLDVRTLAAQPTGLAVVRGLDHGSRVLAERMDALLAEFIPMPYEAIHADKAAILNVVPGDWPTLEATLRASEAAVLNNRGVALADLGQWRQAERSYRRALALDPKHALAHNNLGNALRQLGQVEEAERCYRQALLLRPDLPQAHNHLANALRDLGRLEEAEASYRLALVLPHAYSNLLFLLNYIPSRSAAEVHAEHLEFARRFAAGLRRDPLRNASDPERKLRIGYVSGDLREHSVAFFIEPALANHDRRDVDVFCYYNYPLADATTARLKAHTAGWRDVAALSDEALAALVREDGIDVLVDLSGHTSHNRLLTFARKPAPVQATWLGYLNTTGLEAMDYRLTDPHASPEGRFDAFHSERLVRLPDSQWCYQPPAACPEVAPAPCERSGRITFAVFTTPPKISRTMLEAWSRLLERVPASRLLVVTGIVGSVPRQLAQRFTQAGIPADRLELHGSQAFDEYLLMHGAADVMLDTHPYSGGTTTCHALWMGVPVVTLAGDTPTSRGGASLLHAAGLGDLVAESADRYVEIAASLAGDAARIAALRAGMRERLRASALMDARRFTRNLEAAFRSMWKSWCECREP